MQRQVESVRRGFIAVICSCSTIFSERELKCPIAATSDGDFGKYFHLPVSVNFGKWILFTGKLPVNKKKSFNNMKKLKIRFINGLLMQNKVETSIECI
jgi:hypothetical protein